MCSEQAPSSSVASTIYQSRTGTLNRTESPSPALRAPSPPAYVFSALVGMARCAVPARAVAGGTHVPATLAFEAVAPLHAARTSQRDVPTTLNSYPSPPAYVFSELVGMARCAVPARV